jgi:LuxR family maltose regulon positive regulatory protein
MADASVKARQGSVLEILIVRAVALAAQGKTPDALATLGRALTPAAPEGYIRSFIDEGPAMWALLKSIDAGAVASAHGYVPQLLAAIVAEEGPRAGGYGHFVTAHPTSPPSGSELAEPLTERELEVLRLIAAGHTNADVAKALVIALSTVKTHTNTIFGKLGVKNRTQAIARARDLQLL